MFAPLYEPPELNCALSQTGHPHPSLQHSRGLLTQLSVSELWTANFHRFVWGILEVLTARLRFPDAKQSLCQGTFLLVQERVTLSRGSHVVLDLSHRPVLI